MEPMTTTTLNRGPSPAPRIPTPAALRSSSPLELPILSPTSSSTSTPSIPAFPNPRTLGHAGARDVHPPPRLPPLRSPSSSGLDRLPPLSMHALTGAEVDSPDELESAGRTRPGGVWDLGWFTREYNEATSTQVPAPTASGITTSRPPESQPELPSVQSRSDPGNINPTRPLRALPGTRRVASPPPTRPLTVNTGLGNNNFGSSSVDSAIPTSAFSERRMPLPRVDLEHDWMSESTSSGFVGGGSSGFAGASSRFAGVASSRVINSGSSAVGSDEATSPFGSAFSPGLGDSLSPIVNGPASPPFGGLASPIGAESVASTVQSDDEPNPGVAEHDRAEVAVAGGHPALATFGSPSTSGSSASTRTTPSAYTRRPPSLSLRGFPTSPTFSSMSGPVSAAASFVLPESPTFPVSASPRTSTFDLAVTPPGSALPSFVARMMEVDSPVRESGEAYTIPELVLEPRAENDAASIDALRRFAQGTTPGNAVGGSNLSESPNPEIRREPIRFPLSALESLGTAGDLSARALRQFDEPDRAPLFPPPREASEVAQQGSSFSQQTSSFGSSSFSTSTDVTAHQLEESGPVWSSRPSDLGSAYSQRLTESGVSYPSRPSASDTSYPSFRANVSPGPELNMGSRPGRLLRDMSWSFSDVFRPGHEGSMEALSGSSSEVNLRSHEHDEGDNGGTRAGVRSALTRAARLGGPARGNESLPRLHLNALPRVSGVEPLQDEQSQTWSAMTTTSATNLSRTPPGTGPSEHEVPSLAEAWLEEGSRSSARPPPPRRMSGPRWMDLFTETPGSQPVAVPTAQRPSNRPRMPPAIPMSSADSTLYDPLSGMNWPSDSHSTPVPFVEQAPRTETRPEPAQDSLARYQTFAQSIDELRRSPAHLQPANPPANPWGSGNGGNGLRLPPVITPSTTTAFPTGSDTARTESTGLSGISTWYNDGNNGRPAWATPRHEPLPMLDEPRRSSRSPYRNNDSRQSPPESPLGPPGGGWLREWERERDRQSRRARDNYLRQREMEAANNAAPPAGPSGLEQRRRAASVHRPITQLSDTQAQGRMWDEYTARHEPRPWPTMTRASLAATGFADDDLPDQWSHNGNPMDLWGSMPRRRPEVVPPRSNEADAPAQYSEPNANRISDLPFTESPPSLLQEFIDMNRNEHYHDSFSTDVFQSFQRTNSSPNVSNPPPEFRHAASNPSDFRQASEALRRSLVTTSHRTSRERDNNNSSSRPGPAGQARNSPSSRRLLSLQGEGPVQSQPGSATSPSERPRLSVPRDRWDVQLARSQSQLDRMRQLLHSRSGESREREPPRRLLTDPRRPTATQTSRRRSLMSTLETEPVSPTSLEPRTTQWPREYQRQSHRQDDRASWSSSDSPTSRSNFHDIIRAVRRRRTLLPESSAPPRRTPSSSFLNSMDHALHQVESGLQHINRELSALADENDGSMRRFSLQGEPAAPQVTRSITPDHNHNHNQQQHDGDRMDWAYDHEAQVERSSSPPPRLPPFEFSHLQRNVDWPASRRESRRYEDDTSLTSYFEQRQAQRDALPRAVRSNYTYEAPWRGEPEGWTNDAGGPARDRLFFRVSAPSRDGGDGVGGRRIVRHPDGAGSSLSTQPAPVPTLPLGRLHRRRPSPPGASLNTPPPAPTSPVPPTRSYTSRLSQFLPRRSSGRGPTANTSDHDEWAQPNSATSGNSGRNMFFLRSRRSRTTSGGDFLRDEEFDDSYEGLLRLAARIGDAKPRGTPSEVIAAMPSG
ncbi:hypothetical protein FRC12_013102, partial [Ceratobasidium sp. 428]